MKRTIGFLSLMLAFSAVAFAQTTLPLLNAAKSNCCETCCQGKTPAMAAAAMGTAGMLAAKVNDSRHCPICNWDRSKDSKK